MTWLTSMDHAQGCFKHLDSWFSKKVYMGTTRNTPDRNVLLSIADNEYYNSAASWRSPKSSFVIPLLQNSPLNPEKCNCTSFHIVDKHVISWKRLLILKHALTATCLNSRKYMGGSGVVLVQASGDDQMQHHMQAFMGLAYDNVKDHLRKCSICICRIWIEFLGWDTIYLCFLLNSKYMKCNIRYGNSPTGC